MSVRREFCLIVVMAGVCAVVAACAPERKPTASVQLNNLAMAFGVQWPSNCSEILIGEWRYRAFLDNNSKNHQIVIRMNVPPYDLVKWVNAISNQVDVLPNFAMERDENVYKRFPWWDGKDIPLEHISYFNKDIYSNSIFAGKLQVYIVESNDLGRLYIQGWLIGH